MVLGRTAVPDPFFLLNLLAPQEIQDLQDSLIAATGLHLSLVTPSGRPLSSAAALPPACRLARRFACRLPEPLCTFGDPARRRLLGECSEPILSQYPLLELRLAAVPIRANDAWLATAVAGRVMPAAVPDEEWLEEMSRCLRLGVPELRAALRETPVVDEARFRALVSHVQAVVASLGRLAEARLAEQRARQAIESTNVRLGVLGAIGASITRASKLEDSLGEALQTILDVLQLDSGAVLLRDKGATDLLLAAHRGVSLDFAALAGEALAAGSAWGSGLLQLSLAPWVVPDVAREPGLSASALSSLQIGAFVAAPLRAAEETLGVLTVHTAYPRDFRADEVALIAAAGEQLGIGVQGLRLLSAEKRRAGELAVLNKVAGAVSASLEPHVIAERALDTILRLFPAGAGLVYLLDGETGDPALAAYRGLAAETAGQVMGRPPVGWSLKRGAAPAAQWGLFEAEASLLGEGLKTFISVPLRGQQRTVGLLLAFARELRAFLPNEIELFQAVARQVGLALENAHLYHEAQRRLVDLEDLQRFNERILHTMQEGIFLTDANGRVSYATPRLAELCGYSVQELLGRDWGILARPEERGCAVESFGLLQSGRNTRCEFDLLRKDGSLRHIAVGAVPLFEGQAFSGMLGVVTDLTEEAQLRRRLRQAEKLSAIGELVSGVAHELNNPLTVIRGYAQLLCGQNGSEAAERELRAISQHAERAARVVQGLLTFAREHPRIQETVDLNAVLQSVLDACEPQMAGAGIRVIPELAAGLPRVQGDHYQLQQVFVNILTNAEQAMAQAGRGGEIRVRTSITGDGQLLVAIADNGPGIPAALADRIFDPFFTTRAEQQGTGLGLSICYGIVRAHNGRVWVESAEGQGATFYVMLPAFGRVRVAEEPMPREREAQLAPTGRPNPAAGSRVLVLEDEVEIATLVERFLEDIGCRVSVAHEGQAALDLAHEHQFDVVLTDLKMPGMSGRAFFAHLSRLNPEMAGRVVFVTGDVVSPETKRYLQETGRPHLAKPFSLDDLERLVVETMRGGQGAKN